MISNLFLFHSAASENLSSGGKVFFLLMSVLREEGVFCRFERSGRGRIGRDVSAEPLRGNGRRLWCYGICHEKVTDGRSSLPVEVPELLSRVREVFSLPVALGFGLRSPPQFEALPEAIRPDAAVFESSLLRHIAEGKSPADFMKTWRA